MDEELQVALAKIIETTISAKDFCIEQAPDVISQLLAWNMWISLIWFVASVIVLSLGIWGSVKAWKSVIDGCYDEVVAVFVSVIAVGVPIIILLCSTTWLKILIAPKVYLLEYASQFVK